VNRERSARDTAPRRWLFDHHVHTDRSDGRASLASRARSSASVRPHGVSDHFPYHERMRTDDDVLRYLDDAARLGLRVGIEYDLGVAPPLRASTLAALDYVIGAVHQVFLDGRRVGFDEAGAYLKGLMGKAAFRDAARFADEAFRRRILDATLEAVREGVERVGIDILGHPTFTPIAALGDPEAGYPLEWQERLIELCRAGSVAIEVNEAYGVPHAAFLARALARGALFSVGSDSPHEIRPLDRTEAMIDEAGLPRERFLAGRRQRALAPHEGGVRSTTSSS
jgi:histidinol phosphatase-like PHP family hydrolase